MENEKDKQKEPEKVKNLTPKVVPEEFGGAKGPDPTRYGDWEKNGRVSDF